MSGGRPIEDFYVPEPNSGCWIWIGVLTPQGYGRVTKNGRKHVAHKWLYEQKYGPVPRGLELDHLCRVRCCCNPDHVEAVTHRENVRRGTAPTSINMQATHCKHGHEFTVENIYTNTVSGHRQCRACIKARNHRRKPK